jgi:S-DNA-T family DNA segregation ATPase FtsK/SpoIIIE
MRREAVARIVVSLVILGGCAFVAVSLLTFDRGDVAAYRLPPASPVHNRAGLVGAHLAAFLLETLGACVGVALALAAGWSVLNLLGRGLEQVVARAFGAMVLVACACTFANAAGEATASMPGYGGSVGVALGGMAVRYFGEWGKWLLGVPLTMLALLLMSVDELLAPPALRLAGAAKAGLGRLLSPPKPRKRAASRRTAAVEVAIDPGFREADTAVLPEHDETSDVTETAETMEDELDTGRPVTAGYLDNLEQAGRDTATVPPVFLDDETPTEEELDEPRRSAARARPKVKATYKLPPASLLEESHTVDKSLRREHVQQQIEVLERTLGEFGVGARVVAIEQGPVVTRYELSLEAGTKVSKLTSLSDDLAIATKAPAVRVVAPIPGKSTVGVELPNTDKELVRMRDIIDCDLFHQKSYTIPLFIGKDASGQPIVGDLTRMPHLLIAGATGSGKSVCINSIITSFLMTKHPDDVQLILIDPKMVELASFAALPHLLTPVVTDMKRAAWILDWACRTMDERYDTLAAVGVRSIAAFNRLGEEEIRTRLGEDVDYDKFPFHLPYIVIIVDELADMMMLAAKTIETSITRLAQKSRAVGLHIILATQRPSVDVITGLIKSNLPTRVSFQVTSKVDSRTILDRNGAEKLLGCGDMLFLPPGSSSLIRAQGTYVSDDEIREIVGYIKEQRQPDFALNLDGVVSDDDDTGASGGIDGYSGDEHYEDACRIVLATGRGSVSLLQRKLEIGYTRAARLIDMMAAEGLVGDYKGSKAREVVMTLDEWEAKHGMGTGTPAASSTDEHYEALDAAAEDDE